MCDDGSADCCGVAWWVWVWVRVGVVETTVEGEVVGGVGDGEGVGWGGHFVTGLLFFGGMLTGFWVLVLSHSLGLALRTRRCLHFGRLRYAAIVLSMDITRRSPFDCEKDFAFVHRPD